MNIGALCTKIREIFHLLKLTVLKLKIIAIEWI